MDLLVKKYMITRVVKPVVIKRLMPIDKQVLHRNTREWNIWIQKLSLLIEQLVLANKIRECKIWIQKKNMLINRDMLIVKYGVP